MALFQKPDEILYFSDHMSIEIDYRNTVSYYKCKGYDPKIMNQGFVWHQIIVRHHGRSMLIDGKYAVLEAIFSAVEGEEFYPIAYRRGDREDRFLIRQCQPALKKLFVKNLCLNMPKGIVIHLKVQLNVGQYKYGQISPITQMIKAINNRYGRMERRDGKDGIINLSQFARNPELRDVVVNLRNRGTLERLCDLIYRDNELFRHINGIILSNNDINTLAPLKLFSGVQFEILDLRDNLLRSPTRVCRDLEPLKADELMLQGNPITRDESYPECLRPILNNFKKIDGILSENLSSQYTPLSNFLEVESEAYRIDWTNKADINKFEHSTNWHAFVIPDANHIYTKEKIFDYFFLTISNTLCDIYPCYYKFMSGKHKFLVRNCFEQIKYLVENRNLKIKVPHLEALPPFTDTEEQMDSAVDYYLLMNFSPFKNGQVEPSDCIEKALNRRFSAMDKILNLNNFQSIGGLENIIINLSSPMILNSVLILAARKFVCICNEIRLANNNIVGVNFTKALVMMRNLKAIDLGYNWIRDLDDIKDLAKLKIKSLRLDGNPLCSKYRSPKRYIQAVKKYFPELQILDKIKLPARGYLTSRRNFLCNTAGFDFVNEFITRYFRTYEHKRAYLKNLYHSEAILTLTCNYKVAKISSLNSKRISTYFNFARNIQKISKFRRAYKSMYYGPDAILRVLLELPETLHDIMTFKTDCITYNKNMIVIIVNGVYLDQAANIRETDVILGFSRTFILTPIKRKTGIFKLATRYQIINDQLNVFTPTVAQIKTAFKYSKHTDKSRTREFSKSDKEAYLVMFQEVTSLKRIWCNRCLEEANWNFKKALKIFKELCEEKEIPNAAFN